MAETVTTKYVSEDKPSVQLPLDSLEQDFGYTGSNLAAITVVYQGVTYVQTFTYSGDNVVNVSQFVPQ